MSQGKRADYCDELAAGVEPDLVSIGPDSALPAGHPAAATPPLSAYELDPEGRVPALLPCTDTGNAERLVRAFGEDIRYCSGWSEWLVWDGGRWVPDALNVMQQKAKATVRGIAAESEQVRLQALRLRELGNEQETRHLEKQANELRRHAKASEARGRREAMVNLAASEPGIVITHDQLDRDPWLLNVANGTVDLRSGKLRPHRRADLITKQIAVAYDPSATCPLWMALLERSMAGNDALITFLQRIFGYALSGSVKEQSLFLFHGEGANGKSTILETMLSLMSGYATAAVPDMLMERSRDVHPTELTDLFGVRMAVTQEAKEGRRWDEARVKRLTGGDTIKARRMNEDFWSFQPTHKLFVAANHRPTVRGLDHAIWRRIKLIPFNVTIPEGERDLRLGEKLLAERPGILRWAVEGCLLWQRHGLGAPEEVSKATAAYRADQDVLAAFLQDRCQFQAETQISRQALRQAYERWCEDNGEGVPMSAKTFAEQLRQRRVTEIASMREPGRKDPVRGWRGLRLKDSGGTEAAREP